MKSILVLFCLFTLPALAASNSSGCPTSTKNIQTANNVAANFSNNTTTKVTTYTFTSLINENPVNGVPGLVRYCVYPTPAATPTAHTVSYEEWLFRQDPSDFGFVRPNGNKSNVPLDDGTSHEMGTATWTDLPTDQTIILHIADPTVCASIYGGTPPTCFVKPKADLCATGAGSTVAAYNAIPLRGRKLHTAQLWRRGLWVQ